MKIIYIGCKTRMNTSGMGFDRGVVYDVSEKMGGELLKIDGFVTAMTVDAKAELKKNNDRELKEKAKLESGVVFVDHDDEIVALRQKLDAVMSTDLIRDFKLEIGSLNKKLNSANSEIAKLAAEGKQKSVLISELSAEVDLLTKKPEPKKNANK